MGVPGLLVDAAPRSESALQVLWREALVTAPTYQGPRNHHGRLSASARFLLLASGHALRPLNGEKKPSCVCDPSVLLRRDWTLWTAITRDHPR
jgi:hypothetical protein